MHANVLPRGSYRQTRARSPLLALVGACVLVFLCAEAWAWQTNVSGTAGGGVFNATAVDGAGNVVAAGYITNTDTGNDFTVVKVDGASGAELWRHVISIGTSTGYYSDKALAVAVDGAGNVVAAGMIMHTSPTSRAKWSDILVVKMDRASGAELWRQVLTGTSNDQDPTDWEDVAYAVAIDGAGNVVVGGRIMYTAVVVKLEGATGAELWRRFITGSAGGRNRISGVAVDGSGHVVAAGKTFNTDPNAGRYGDFSVVKLDGATGVDLWRQVIWSGAANAVAVDGAGNVVAAGYTTSTNTGQDFTVVNLDGASGAELWRQVISNGSSVLEAANAVAVDEAGNVVAAGVTENTGPSTDFTVAKFNVADGAELWRQMINGTASNSVDQANAVAIDGAGNVVAAGSTQNASNSGTSTDFTVVKLDGASGTERQRQVIGSASGTSGQARAIRVDGAGDVIAAGAVSNTATVVKLAEVPPPDTTPPTVTITAPTNLAIVSGMIAVAAGASDNVGLLGVQFYLDGAPLGAEVTTAPYAVSWNSTTASNGSHTLTAVARDATGNHGTSTTVTVHLRNNNRHGGRSDAPGLPLRP